MQLLLRGRTGAISGYPNEIPSPLPAPSQLALGADRPASSVEARFCRLYDFALQRRRDGSGAKHGERGRHADRGL